MMSKLLCRKLGMCFRDSCEITAKTEQKGHISKIFSRNCKTLLKSDEIAEREHC